MNAGQARSNRVKTVPSGIQTVLPKVPTVFRSRAFGTLPAFTVRLLASASE